MIRRLVLAALAIWLLLCLAPAVQAQTPILDSARAMRAALDSIRLRLRADSLAAERVADSLEQARIRAADRMVRSFTHPTETYALTLAAGDLANALLHVDVDRGGYVDRWGTPDKWVHFSAASFLVDHAARMRVPLRWAVPLTCAGAWGFELSQGHVSWRDATASCTGAALGAAFRLLESRLTPSPE